MYSLHPTYEQAIEADRGVNRAYADSLNFGGKTIYSNGVSNQPGSSSGNGNSGSGNGPPSWFERWAMNHSHFNNRGGGGGGGGVRLEGAKSIPNMNLPPTVTSGTPSSTNPFVIIIILAALGVGGYLLYHKLHKAKAEETDLSKKGE